MTADPSTQSGLGPLGHRLRWAFLTVCVGTVAIVTAAALIGTDRGLDTETAEERTRVAARVAASAALAYADAGGWGDADLGPATAVAAAADAALTVLDSDGRQVLTSGAADATRWSNAPGRGVGPPGGGVGGVTAPVLVGTTEVGAVRVGFGRPATGAARTIAWWWIGVAALGALALALLAARFVERRVSVPLAAVAATARAFGAGDRTARTGLQGSGEIAEVAHALDEMADAVAFSERSRRRAAAEVAHELRTPLAVLQAGLEEARDGLVEPEPTLLASLHDQTLRLGRIVADLAALSAAEDGAMRLSLQSVDLADLALAELAAQEARLRACGLVASADVVAPVLVQADPDRLRQVLDNLLSNAARYCRPGDAVTVRVHTAEDRAVLEVADTGPGIPAEELPHVFERWWRGSAADRVAGSGIGLAVVHELVAAHGGVVAAESDGGSGTTLRVELPLAEQGPGISPGPSRPGPPSPG